MAREAELELKSKLAARDKNDMTPLHWMASFGTLPLVQLAISQHKMVHEDNQLKPAVRARGAALALHRACSGGGAETLL